MTNGYHVGSAQVMGYFTLAYARRIASAAPRAYGSPPGPRSPLCTRHAVLPMQNGERRRGRAAGFPAVRPIVVRADVDFVVHVRRKRFETITCEQGLDRDRRRRHVRADAV